MKIINKDVQNIFQKMHVMSDIRGDLTAMN